MTRHKDWGLLHQFRAVRALLKVSLMGAIQYRSNLLVSLLIGACNAVGVALPLWFVYAHVASVAGWSLPAALAVAAFFLLMTGILGTVVEPNLGAVVEGVRSGALDYVLIRPVDGQLLVSLARVDPTRVWEIVAGAGLLIYVWPQLGVTSLWAVALAALLFGAGLAAMYSLYLAIICLSFWFVRVDNLRFLIVSASDAGRWPVDVYKGTARTLLTVVIPVAVVTSFPVMALTGGIGWEALGGVGVGAGALIGSRWMWGRAVKFYASASS